jgi:hypothetical protein
MITLSDGSITLELHPDLYWSDELSWAPVSQNVERTITGALDIQASTLSGGRPITLEPEDDSAAWMPYASVVQLQAWAAIAGQQLTLTLPDGAHTVVFRHQDGALSARPVVQLRDRLASDFYLCVIRLMEI